MLKVIQGLALTAILGLLAVGCGTDHNPMGSPNQSDLKQNTPQTPSILGNRVWNDVDKDGLQDDTLVEPGIAGVSVSLYTCADVKLSTVVTNTKGVYIFPMLAAGNYYVKFTPPQGYVFVPKDAGPDSLDSDVDRTTGKTDCFPLAVSTADLTWDAGLYQGQIDTVVDGTVGGRVWFDANQDGIQNESLLGDVVDSLAVELFTCTDSLVAATQTDLTGGYGFVDIAPGQYYLLFTPPEGYEFSPNNVTNDSLASDPDPFTGKTVCFQVDSAEVELTWDAGIFPQPVDTLVNGTVGGRVWFDVNKDGLRNDAAQPAPVDSLPVELFTCAGGLVATARTGLAGEYEFSDLVPGQYFLLFTLPMGYKFSSQDAADDSLDSDPNPCTGKTVCFQVDSAEVELTWDAGIWPAPPPHGCTHSRAYWKNHVRFSRQRDILRDLLPLWLGSPGGAAAIEVADARTAIAILQMKTYGNPFNGITKLYAQLLAAKLNIASGADGSAAEHEIEAADNFLGAHGWHSWGHLSKANKKQVVKWTSIFTRYNSGEIGPGSCGDSDDNDRDHEGSDYSDNDDHDGGNDGGAGQDWGPDHE